MPVLFATLLHSEEVYLNVGSQRQTLFLMFSSQVSLGPFRKPHARQHYLKLSFN